MKESILFREIKIGGVTIKNRFVMPAMSSHTTENHKFLDRGVAYYSERAKGGYGLLITEFTAVDKFGLGGTTQPGIWDDSFIPSLKKLTDGVHKEGGIIFCQLHHAGIVSKIISSEQRSKGPSALVETRLKTPLLAYSNKEIYEIIKMFIDGAERAKKAGFDGVEVQGAHAYLIKQFLNPNTNKRVDEFGGTYENRFRIAHLIIKGIKERCGKDYPISFRINAMDYEQDGSNLKDCCIYSRMAEKAGADCINVSIFNHSLSYFAKPGFNAENARKVKECVQIPVIVAGRINDEFVAENIIQMGNADMVACGKQSIADPYFPTKVFNGEHDLIFHCVGCMQRCSPEIGCEPEDVGISCMINPFSGKELRWKIEKVKKPLKIAVIGAGCSGMQAAWILSARGHQVTVYDKSDRIGGLMIPASIPENKYGLIQAVHTYLSYCKKYNVKFELNKEITDENIISLDTDIIIVATGSKPFIPRIKGLDEKFLTAQDVLNGKIAINNKKVAVLGGGSVGIEVSEYLLKYNNEITVIEKDDKIAKDMVASIRTDLLDKLTGRITILLKSSVTEISEKREVKIMKEDKIKNLGIFDEIVIAVGYKSNNNFENLPNNIKTYVIGDAKNVKNAKMNIYEATKLALKI